MGFKKMKNKRGELTITKLVVNLLIVIGIFSAAFTWFDGNATSAGITIDSKYSDVNSNLLGEQSSLDTNVQDIRESVQSIQEADNVAQVAWNGLKGVGSAVKLPISFVGTTINILTSTLGLGIIPSWLSTLITIALIAIVVLLILASLKGESKM